LTGVTGYTGTIVGKAAGIGISYAASLLVYQVQHANGIVDTQALDPNAMARPASIASTGGSSWSSGSYAYDGSGNITKIGGNLYLYDGVSRLASSAQSLLPAGGGTPVSQTYAYDAFGNLLSTTGANGLPTPT